MLTYMDELRREWRDEIALQDGMIANLEDANVVHPDAEAAALWLAEVRRRRAARVFCFDIRKSLNRRRIMRFFLLLTVLAVGLTAGSAVAEEGGLDGQYRGTAVTVYQLSEALCGPTSKETSMTVEQGFLEYESGPSAVKIPVAPDGTFRNRSSRGGGAGGGVRYSDIIEGKLSNAIIEGNFSVRNRIIGGDHPTICEYHFVLKKG
jgi:hypothetical protein